MLTVIKLSRASICGTFCLALAACNPGGRAPVPLPLLLEGSALRPAPVSAPPFSLAAAATGPAGSDTVLIVIEGDGHAYDTRRRASGDPTPRRPRGLDLARALAAHHRPVAYLARPCQWSPGDLRTVCRAEDWTTARFSPRILAASAGAVEALMDRVSARRAVLVGYSGGAQLAVMIARRSGAVTGLGTLSGVVDHAAWTAHHGVSPLAGSSAPPPPPDIPQIHILGTADTVAPPHLLREWLDTASDRSRVAVLAVEGMGHDGPIPQQQAATLATLAIRQSE